MAVGPGANGALELYTTYGRDELDRGVLRPDPRNPSPALFAAKAASYRARWPRLVIAGAA